MFTNRSHRPKRRRMSTKHVRSAADLARFKCALKIECAGCGNSTTLDGFDVAKAYGTKIICGDSPSAEMLPLRHQRRLADDPFSAAAARVAALTCLSLRAIGSSCAHMPWPEPAEQRLTSLVSPRTRGAPRPRAFEPRPSRARTLAAPRHARRPRLPIVSRPCPD